METQHQRAASSDLEKLAEKAWSNSTTTSVSLDRCFVFSLLGPVNGSIPVVRVPTRDEAMMDPAVMMGTPLAKTIKSVHDVDIIC